MRREASGRGLNRAKWQLMPCSRPAAVLHYLSQTYSTLTLMQGHSITNTDAEVRLVDGDEQHMPVSCPAVFRFHYCTWSLSDVSDASAIHHSRSCCRAYKLTQFGDTNLSTHICTAMQSHAFPEHSSLCVGHLLRETQNSRYLDGYALGLMLCASGTWLFECKLTTGCNIRLIPVYHQLC